jgi:poly(A)-specific ribonuclease
MEIINTNFVEKLPLILDSIKEADFIALDTEFSGLDVGFDGAHNDYDQCEDRYQKIKHNCERMNAFQVGICCFKWDESRQLYLSRPFNIYNFPHSDILGN